LSGCSGVTGEKPRGSRRILGNGKKARIDGPDISADLGRQQLTHFMTDVVAKWAETHRSTLPSPADVGADARNLPAVRRDG
jgi:hypothetical protein